MTNKENRTVNIQVPIDKLSLLFKAVKDKEDPDKSVEYFASQNPASRKLVDIVEESYEAMIHSMSEEIRKVLSGNEP